MRIVNRFVELSLGYPDHEIPIDRIFQGAGRSEIDSVVEAMYVIASRRASSGNPVNIYEITRSIPSLVEEKSVLDAAIDICVEGLLSEGHSQDKAYQIILESTGSHFENEQVEKSADISAFIEHSALSSSAQVRRLPTDFGQHEHEGLKRYELRRFIGSGSHGNMYEAVDRVFAEDGTPSLVALKIAHDDEGGDRSMLEGARARRIRHKNVARVHDCGLSDANESYVVYEFVDGLPLDAWIKNLSSPLSVKEACQIVMKIADGIQTAHNAGVIHRDIKPSNILITRDNEPIITDFGIAHTATSDPRLSSYYGTRGSLAFMAPEQYHGTNEGVMPSVDIYALGGLLYWLVSGRFPNGETVSDALVRLDSRNEGGDERFYSHQIHLRLRCIIERALSVDLSERYSSASVLALDIESFVNRQPIPWHDKSWISKSILFVQRNPIVVMLNFMLMGLFGLVVAVWVSSQSQIQLEKSQSKAALEIQKIVAKSTLETASLNKQIELEQVRVRQLRERNLMAQNMLKAWSQAANNRDSESITMSNILFLYTVSKSGFLDSDQDTAEQILSQRVRIAHDYLATLSSTNSSPILRAQWHEMLGVWYLEMQDPKQGNAHLGKALALIHEHAPNDTIWINKIESIFR